MYIIRTFLVIVGGCAGFLAGRDVSLSDQWPFFEALRTTGSIVFGVTGALLAIVYPEVVKNGFRANNSDSLEDTRNLKIIVDPLAQSAMILLAIVLLGPIFAWLDKSESSKYLQGASFSLLAMLTLWQAWVLILVLRPLDILWSHTQRAKATQDIRRRLHEFGKRDKP